MNPLQVKHLQLIRHLQVNHLQLIRHLQVNHPQLIRHLQVNHLQLIRHLQVNHLQLIRHLQVNHLQQPELLRRLEAVVPVMMIVSQSKGTQVSVIVVCAWSTLIPLTLVTKKGRLPIVPQDLNAGVNTAGLAVMNLDAKMEYVTLRKVLLAFLMESVTALVHAIVKPNNDHELLLLIEVVE